MKELTVIVTAALGVGDALAFRRKRLVVLAFIALAANACSSSPNDPVSDSGAPLLDSAQATDGQPTEVAQQDRATDAAVDLTPEARPIAHCCRTPPPADPDSLDKCDILGGDSGVSEPCTPNNLGGYGDWSCGGNMCSDNGRSCELGAPCELSPGSWGCHGTVVPCDYPYGD
jgi:hypothetical protein